MAWPGTAGVARQGMARQGTAGGAWRGGAWLGEAWQATHGDLSRSIKGLFHFFHRHKHLENARGDDSNHLAVPKVIGRVLFG